MITHFDAKLGEFALECIYVMLDGDDIDFPGSYKGIHIAGNVEVVVVFGNFGPRHDATVPLDLAIEQLILVFARLEAARGVDEEYVVAIRQRGATLPASVKQQDGHWNGGGLEEVCRKTNDCVEQIFIDDGFTIDAFFATTKEDAVGDNDSDAALQGLCRFDHVSDESPIAFRLWRDTRKKRNSTATSGDFG